MKLYIYLKKKVEIHIHIFNKYNFKNRVVSNKKETTLLFL